MTTRDLLLTGWAAGPWLIAGTVLALAAHAVWARRLSPWFLAAMAVVVVALASPINALAEGTLFSAHMLQHLLLLLVAPALAVLSVPATVRVRVPPLLAWAGGVGSMWFWHIPKLCDAATASAPIHAVQTLSLLALGCAFWWPIAAPAAENRLHPLGGIAYLFTACLACTALGILLALTPIEVCPIYRTPGGSPALLNLVRDGWGFSSDRDRQVGGLLMWVPMCLGYLSAIFLELARWYEEPARPTTAVLHETLP